MTKVKVYEVFCHEAYMMSEKGTGFALEPWGKNTLHYKGHDDGGKDYILPDGCSVGEIESGLLKIFDASDNICVLGSLDDAPVLYDSLGWEIRLALA